MGNMKEVIVVGGGIGGLAAVYGIAKQGKKVTVLEQAAKFGEVGAGLQLAPNGLRALDQLGLLDEVYKHATYPRRHVFMDILSGEELSAFEFGDAFRERYGYPYIVIHRTDLHSVLLNACRSLDNVEFLSGHKLINIEEHDGYVQLFCDNGAELQAQMVIGADGIRSQTRKLVSNDEIVPSGYVAYRFTVPIEEMQLDIDWGEKYTWIGPGVHMVQYPVRDKSVINQVAVFKSKKFIENSDNWGTIDELYEMFADSCPTIRESLKYVDRGFSTKLFDRDPIANWSTKRVTLLGDAAHPMLQYLAQGAGQSLEDAACLTQKIQTYGATSKALELYQNERILRTSKVQRGARLWGEIKHAEDKATILLRNTIMEKHESTNYEYLDWLYQDLEFDAETAFNVDQYEQLGKV